VASIAPDHAPILTHCANPCGWDFWERQAFAMATLAGARRYGIHFDLLSSGAQQMKDAGFTLPEGTSPP
jgi:hypothetical protein